MPNVNSEVIVTGFKDKLKPTDDKTIYNFNINSEHPLVEVQYDFSNQEKQKKMQNKVKIC